MCYPKMMKSAKTNAQLHQEEEQQQRQQQRRQIDLEQQQRQQQIQLQSERALQELQQQQPGTSQQVGGAPGTSDDIGNAGIIGGTSGGSIQLSEVRKKQIQQQLMLLLHAQKCNRRGSVNPQGERCSIPYCTAMQEVLSHLGSCEQGKDCAAPNCLSSRQILSHYNSCQRADCCICAPIRQVQEANKPVSAPGAAPDSTQSTDDGAGSDNDWRESMSTEIRNHMAHKLVQAIFPSFNPAIMQDFRIIGIAENVERSLFETAKSRTQYYHLMAEKIYSVQKSLDEQLKNRMQPQRDNRNNGNGGNGSGSSGAFNVLQG